MSTSTSTKYVHWVDPLLWSSITELSEMGVNVDLSGFINAGKQDLLHNVRAETKSNKLRSMEVVENLSSVIGASTDIDLTRDIKLDGPALNTNMPLTSASMSLGLSSRSFHVPFTSPFTGIPSPIPSLGTGESLPMDSRNSSINTTAAKHSHYNQRRTQDPTTAALSSSSTFSESRLHRDGDMSSSIIFADAASADLTYSQLSLMADPRATLFGLPTPAAPADSSQHLLEAVSTPPRHSHHHPHGGNSSSNDDPQHSGTARHSGLTQDFLNTRISRDSSGISGVRQRLNPPSTASKGGGPYTHASSGSAYTGTHAATNSTNSGRLLVSDPAAERTGRRVSFGPTARLSFGLGVHSERSSHLPLSLNLAASPPHTHHNSSGIAHSGPDTSMMFPRMSAASSASSSSSSEQPLSNTATSVKRGEDEHPFKMQRKGSRLGSGFPSQEGGESEGGGGDGHQQQQPFAAESSPILLPADATAYDQSTLRGFDTTLAHPRTAAAHSTHEDSHRHSSSRDQAAELALCGVVGTFARAYQLLCAYRCRESVAALHELPLCHFRSALVSQMVGKAYYEMNEYKPAVLALREMLKLEPFRMQGLDTLSTALWHLKKDKELCSLAQQVVEIDKFCPETWCVMGNCFSLQKEPDTAIRFFQRALQVDPAYTYAHTLCGHEQVNNEDLEKAVASFRAAILCNDRHYNAWYGLGTIFFRQERFELSEYHFRRAIQINPNSSVLHCYLAMTLHAQGSANKTSEALEVLHKACEKDPKNPQLRFQLAHILVSVEDLDGALAALLQVREVAPKEPPVHALLGQVYHKLGPRYISQCLRHLNIAMDLDPKEASSLKAIMDHIDEPAQ